jgi:cholesterol 7-dehydrogenase
VPGIDLRHRATWTVDAERPWIAHFMDDAELAYRGKPIPRTAGHGHALFFGPSTLVVFRISIPFGDVVIMQTHTPRVGPREPMQLRVRFTWWAERSVPRVLAWYVVGNWVSQWWQDVAIWENKVHLAKPALTRGDGPLHELRRWFQQFHAQPERQEVGR